MTHFIDLLDCTTAQIEHILQVAHRLRIERAQGKTPTILQGRTLAMFFEKPSLRTRVSFEQAMYELGGQAIILSQAEVGLGKREAVKDIARVIAGMVDGVMARVFDHENLIEWADHSSIPVINALSDRAHPCQALADVMTMQDYLGMNLSGSTLAFVGDGNNVAASLARICAMLNVRFILASPAGYALDEAEIGRIQRQYPAAKIEMTLDAKQAVAEADVIYTDTWVSMGQESEAEQRQKTFAAYQVNEDLLNVAKAEAIVLHCLPAYRGREITDAVMDHERCHAFAQAHNRLHAQKGLLATLMGGL